MKAAIFDCFGVLTVDHWRAFVDSLPNRDIALRAKELNRQYDSGLITRDEFLAQIHEVTGRAPNEILDILWGKSAKNIALLEYIGQLRQKGVKIGLLSNVGTDWIRRDFLTPDEQKLFDTMVFSYEVGMVKPDPRMFELVCQRLGVDKSEAVLVDDMERFCTAAREQGMQAVEYQDLASAKQQLDEFFNA